MSMQFRFRYSRLSVSRLKVRVRRWSRCTKTFAAVLAHAWPVTLACLILVAALAGPGLASDQAREALASHAASEGTSLARAARLGIPLIASLLLACSLPGWVALTSPRSPQRAVMQYMAFVAPGLALFIASVVLAADQGSAGLATLAILTAGTTGGLLMSGRFRERIIAAEPRSGRTWAIVAMLVLTTATLLFGLGEMASVRISRFLGPVSLTLLFVFVLVAILSSLVRAGRRWNLPLIPGLLIAAFVFSYFNLNDNHSIRGRSDNFRVSAFGHSFADWRASRPDESRYSEYPVILVSAEGGGIRAAYFTGITLARLVDRCPRLASHIFAVSGVSGGSVGATVFAAAMKADPPDIDSDRCTPESGGIGKYERRMAAVLGEDHLSPLLARMYFPDFLQRFLPLPIDAFDRQRGLELSLEEAFRREFGSDLLAMPFSRFKPSSSTPGVPFLILNTTWVETGERIAIAPFVFLNEDFTRLQSLGEIAPDFDPRASAAAGASARFPIVSPAGHLPDGIGRRRFVDGGYVDNSGAETVMEMVRSIAASYGGTDRPDNPRRSSMLLLHIGNAPECEIIEFGAPATPASAHCGRFQDNPYLAGFGEMLSPVRAVVAARGARVQLTLRQLEREVTRAQDRGESRTFHRVQMYDRGVPVPLGWVLSPRTRNELHVQLDALGLNKACETQFDVRNACQLRELTGMLSLYERQSNADRPGTSAR